MIVYGDAERLEPAHEVRSSAARLLEEAGRKPTGIVRHAALVRAFIRASELVQGIADAEFDACGFDRDTAMQRAGALALHKIAEAIDRSWSNGLQADLDPHPIMQLLAALNSTDLIRTRTGEGYAHYALYPESYLEAARRSGLGRATCVIGIRSIGVGLGALVAAALGAGPAISVRPVGHPFDRRIKADPDLLAAFLDQSMSFAIVDEGPGLSGSSFAAVARWLRESGIARERIHFFPSHPGQPGAATPLEIRAIWSGIKRHDARQDEIILHRNGLLDWVGDRIGRPLGPLRDISSTRQLRGGGGGRAALGDARFERRKFVVRTTSGDWLLRFSGLGEIGERKFRDAKLLGEAGFIPQVVGFRHGFMIQRWVKGRPLLGASDRRELMQTLGAYLALRARHLSTPTGGASLEALRNMAVRNTLEALGSEAASVLRASLHGIAALQSRVRPVRTDSRLHGWEWLRTEHGLLKIDAVDHCEAHDLVGCQDIAWDLAGAMVEHDLSQAELDELRRSICGVGVPDSGDELIAALVPCYLAFQLGLWSTATDGAAQRRRVRFYTTRLGRILHLSEGALAGSGSTGSRSRRLTQTAATVTTAAGTGSARKADEKGMR